MIRLARAPSTRRGGPPSPRASPSSSFSVVRRIAVRPSSGLSWGPLDVTCQKSRVAPNNRERLIHLSSEFETAWAKATICPSATSSNMSPTQSGSSGTAGIAQCSCALDSGRNRFRNSSCSIARDDVESRATMSRAQIRDVCSSGSNVSTARSTSVSGSGNSNVVSPKKLVELVDLRSSDRQGIPRTWRRKREVLQPSGSIAARNAAKAPIQARAENCSVPEVNGRRRADPVGRARQRVDGRTPVARMEA